jgi:hypothetical protein
VVAVIRARIFSPFSWTHLAARDSLLDQAFGVGLALVGGFLGLVDQHALDAGHGLDIGDARAHHAGAQTATFLTS